MPPVSAPPAPPAPHRGLLRFAVGAAVAIGLLLALVLLATTVVAVTAITTDSVERRARTFPPVAHLRIDPGGGDVTVVGERRADVRVEMRVHHNAWREDWQPTVALRPGRVLRLDSDCSVWMFAGTGDCGASFTIRVPAATAVTVLGGDASDVRLDALSGPLDIATGSGDIAVDDYRGAVVRAAAGSGDIDVHTVRAPRRLHAQAGSGDVAVAVPDVPYRVTVETGSGDEDVRLRDDPRAARSVTLRTGSGDVAAYGIGAGR